MSYAARSCRAGAWLLGLLISFLAVTAGASAHEIRPAYLQIDEIGQGRFSVLWRTPILSGMRLPVMLRYSDGIKPITEPLERQLSDSVIERRVLESPDELAGQRINFVGLQATITDVLVRVSWLDGRKVTEFVRPARPWIDLSDHQDTWQVARTYTTLGIEHILMGFDHLLFVVGLMIIVRSTRSLVKTITAFTVAHSITLGLATLGYASIPAEPLNAAIALSILFLGVEVVRLWRGQTSFTLRHPWIVAFAFGLLHGFGFASGLTVVGLPRGDIPLALLSFNIGVEMGQLAFVLMILLLLRALRVLQFDPPAWTRYVPGYVVGSLGAFWTIERTLPMF
ncbi:HupE/UreJ family protein [Pseudaminobacter sp. NGMCC 1.201702]|uniref:HupE/UreJ family protein n=1 Tax=Pseudaminobacter sp. NGMCC 1.201702 TaxID=3391825 RepID=UPI0039EFE09A